MSERLIILMPTHEDAPGLWGHMDGAKILAYGREAPPEKFEADIVAVVAGQSVRCYTHDLPATSKKDRMRAAAFSIEDKVSQPLDDIHLVLDEARIAVMSKADLSVAIETLSSVGLSPSKAYVDFDLLPESHGDVAVLGRVISGGALGQTVDEDWFDGDTAQTLSDEDILKTMNQKLESGGSLNLLQNEFATSSGLGLARFGLDLRKLAGLAACLGLAALILQSVETRALKLQAKDLRLQTAQLYSEATGQAAPSNPALLATKALKSGGKDNFEFLQLSQTLFQGVAKVEGLSVNQMRYQEARHELQLRLIYPSFESASDFEAAIKAAGGLLVTGGVREQSGEFVGEATLRGGS